MQLSDKGAAQLGGLEGYVIRAYKDLGGVVTVGPGFTWLSKVFRDYWMATRGARLKVGDELPLAEALTLLPKVFDEEYGAAVNDKIQPKTQWHYDGAGSVAYNAGTGSLAWKWALALRDGLVAKAATLLLTTAVTVKGKPVEGLKRRRRIEAATIKDNVYALDMDTHISTAPKEVMEYQLQLQALGYYQGPIDGKVASSDEAVRQFQADNKMRVDGKVGSATRATLGRKLADRNGRAAAGVGGVGGIGGGAIVNGDAGVNHIDSWAPVLLTALGVVVVVVIIVWAINNRGLITGNRTPA